MNETASHKTKAKERLDVTGNLPMTGLVFVYGTLKRAYWNHRLLKGAKFIGEAATAQPYPMVCRAIPYLYNLPGQGHIVMGEVFEVTDPEMMAHLDRLESHPHGYTRTPFKVILRDETKHGDPIKEIEVFVYFINSKERGAFRPEQLADCKPVYAPPEGY